MIFNVQRYSTHDGDGIRTLIFYKGCPLRCQWCSNPESHSFDYSLFYDQKLCKDFGDCLKRNGRAIRKADSHGILIDRKLLNTPEDMKDICASRAITISGEVKSAEELLLEIEKDLPFYRDTGGVTLSGGEPLAQGDELIKLLQLLKSRSIPVNVETSLHVKWEMVARSIGLVDTFLADLKHTQKEKFRAFTRGDSGLVMDNLRKLQNTRAHVIIRIPVIPGFNHTGQEMSELIDFAASLQKVRELHFLPYHTFGLEKYTMLGMEYEMAHKNQVRDWELAPYIQYAELKGLITRIGG
ncbi:MAG: glycyl-radical enzyme activating protein [Bacteroidota bacterium]